MSPLDPSCNDGCHSGKHTTHARKEGETEQRLCALAAWQESPLFNNTERAVLTLTKEITHVSSHGVTEATYQACVEELNNVKLLLTDYFSVFCWRAA
ncbi:carboxymuconolactone decarboxylase family protein [Psychrobium sp. 1_MG-2023]|uniref:carboxymuconolactone decarboxylase family protein n=1 Tax=Psychrobium sp. 1_MG-2023 TaxID=3062624 RepID=UPI001292AC04|nr:carboxymuconolactone decarboxylase family protein [Psychrobium sp. 1_MG-2023]MDP2561503.1 carboxymuconolactone decarboxylase family protein [Psychrobium sp. 1_MG-2023]